ncbi:protein THEMIS2 [Rhinatrema bivittatum]|uniref:protein THEMIS2 n=1 Tax=Rhinatrema bivittatum TaxID=194408 RepID=UPI0011299C4F|nr:protein THEMIS2 [Rhinatrema bivittatum]
MLEAEKTLSFQEYISSLDLSSLPRILQICSGVYFQGSVYEISGSECCLSTGDLIKVISVELQKVVCQGEQGEPWELQPDFEGLFKAIPENPHYPTLEELIRDVPAGRERAPFYFTSGVDFVVKDQVIGRCQTITLLAEVKSKGCGYARCEVQKGATQVCLQIPFSCHGDFYQCGAEQEFTLSQLLRSKGLQSRRFTCSSMPRESVVLSPVYEVQALMQLRRNAVKIPSSLEVDVTDVTSQAQHVKFITPLTLTEVLAYQETFPVTAELLEVPEYQTVFKTEWVSHLRKGQKIQIHSKSSAWRVLVSSRKGNKSVRYFLISGSYRGKFKRKPREFSTAYDLLASLNSGEKLQVVVTKDCECYEDCFPSLSVGDQLQVLYRTTAKTPQETDVLVCNRGLEDDEEGQLEKIMLPLYCEGRFVEEVTNTARYTISEVIQQLKLPCEVKVVAKDPTLHSDILSSFAALTLEELIEDPFLVASFVEKPMLCFELPVKWFEVLLFFTEDSARARKDPVNQSLVEEITDSFYYHLRKLVPCTIPPPPRPPKRASSSSSDPKKADTMQRKPPMRKATLPSSQQEPCCQYSAPPLPAPRKQSIDIHRRSQPNEYSLTKCKPRTTSISSKEAEDDDEHDYEFIDDPSQKISQKVKRLFLH